MSSEYGSCASPPTGHRIGLLAWTGELCASCSSRTRGTYRRAAQPPPPLASRPARRCLPARDRRSRRSGAAPGARAGVARAAAHRVGRSAAGAADRGDRGRLRPGPARAAHEHLASGVIGSFLQLFRAAFATAPSAPSVIAATPAHSTTSSGRRQAPWPRRKGGRWCISAPTFRPRTSRRPRTRSRRRRSHSAWSSRPTIPFSSTRFGGFAGCSTGAWRSSSAAERRRPHRSVLEEVGATLSADFADFRRLLGAGSRRATTSSLDGRSTNRPAPARR